MTVANDESTESGARTQDRLPVTHSVADPAPLGLAAFAMTTLALSLYNTNIWPAAVFPALALALVYGGFAQLLAGMWEFVRKNTFGALAFTSYGAFWIGVYFFINFQGGLAVKGALGLYLLPWILFTLYMTIAAMKVNVAVLLVFVALTLAFLFLTIGAWGGGHTDMTKIGGWLGIITALLAWYASAAGVINETHGKVVLPVGPLG